MTNMTLEYGMAVMAGMALKPYVMLKRKPVLAAGAQKNIVEKAAIGADDAAEGADGDASSAI